MANPTPEASPSREVETSPPRLWGGDGLGAGGLGRGAACVVRAAGGGAADVAPDPARGGCVACADAVALPADEGDGDRETWWAGAGAGSGASGSGFPSSAINASPVTQTGVWLTPREYLMLPLGAISPRR